MFYPVNVIQYHRFFIVGQKADNGFVINPSGVTVRDIVITVLVRQ